MKNLIIIGAGGFGREVAWLVEEINREKDTWNLLGFVDDDKLKHNTYINGYEVLGGLDILKKYPNIYVVCAVGNPKTKKIILDKINKYNINYAILINPSVLKSKFVTIKEGSIVCAGTIITTNIHIGKHVIINLDCTIGHDAVIEDYSTILPSVNISGNVHVKEGVNIGTGTNIINNMGIGEWATIGAGAVVAKNIPSHCTAVGIPAKPIKYHEVY
ncbi:MAG: acetyltransferase [Anaeromicrobium sp.]|jgi:sugar O-acyltransferase (sialic acid O-acetyltransferase NeuD family)|uniref:acetyltransferase n=1 Tax=Anaeromicrobium sp. TaxID=1929132 RepID=UPI0025FAA4C2|nr:acetyltransferase [Anaeromicrobium sp.]MCT4593952.1 acetyltransferase [Anaeromicrobium sp.]